jgi:hypothetical protein
VKAAQAVLLTAAVCAAHLVLPLLLLLYLLLVLVLDVAVHLQLVVPAPLRSLLQLGHPPALRLEPGVLLLS